MQRIASLSALLLGAYACSSSSQSSMPLGPPPEAAEVDGERGAMSGAPPELEGNSEGMGSPALEGSPVGESPRGSQACTEGVIQPGRAPLRRLTRFEYNNTVRDLFGDTTQPANALPPEEIGNGFGNDADATSVSSLLAEQYALIAEGIAARATASSEALERLSPCAALVADAAAGEDDCARTLIDDLGSRAFRRPLGEEEAEQLFALEQTLRSTPGASFESAIAGVIEAILQSPDFLYRVEFGVPDELDPAVSRPSGDEMAVRLSYLFWGSQPDEPLREAARAGALSTAEGVREQAARLLDDPRSHEVVRFFFDNLLPISGLSDIQRDEEQFPAFSRNVGAAMREETQRFLEHEIFEGEGTWPSALTAPYTFVNGPLADFYGIDGVTGPEFVQVPVDTSERLGFLTQAGVMTGTVPTNKSNPVLRGSFIVNQILCRKIQLPTDPAILAQVTTPEDTSGATARERFSKHSSQDVCRSCHQFLDPIGFALENYDSVGQFRTEENGVTIDASGQMPGSDETIVGGVELARWLAEESSVQACFASHWLEFAYGKRLGRDDACTRETINDAFEESGYNVRELLLDLTQTDAFLYYSSSL